MAGALLALCACYGSQPQAPHVRIAGGDVTRGAVAIATNGCGACHRIPGIAGADGVLGPPLDGWAARGYIAGQLANVPANLVRWVMDPAAIEPRTAMPALGLSEQNARDIVAYLYTLN